MMSSFNEMKKGERIFKALSDRTRLRILKLLSIERLCVCELSGILKISQTNLSNHLSLLRALDIVRAERRDRWVYYAITPEMEELIDYLLNVFPAPEEDMKRLKKCLSGSFTLPACRDRKKRCPHEVVE